MPATNSRRPLTVLATITATALGAQTPALTPVVLAPQPLAPQLNAIRFSTGSTGIAVGDYGFILRTTDAGRSWTRVETGVTAQLKGVALNGAIGIAAGEQGVILRSVDTGATWTRIDAKRDELRAVAFGASHVVLIVGEHGSILRSKDDGSTWLPSKSGTTNTLRGIAYAGPSLAYAVGDDGALVASADNGVSWAARCSGTHVALRGIAFLNEHTGIVVGGDDRRWRAPHVVLRTTDGGSTWPEVSTPTDTRLYGVGGIDSTVIAVGESGVLLRSTNSGATWKQDTSVSGRWLGGVTLAANGVGIVTGAGGKMLRAEKGASDWKPVQNGPELLTSPISAIVRPMSNVVLLATGPMGPNATARILRSTDGGATYAKTKTDSVAGILGLAFRDSLVGVAVGLTGAALRTTDGGATWVKVSIDTRRTLLAAAFADSATVVAVGSFPNVEGPALFRSSDAGRTWAPLRHVDDGVLFGLAFHGSKLGLAAGAAGHMLLSHDAGATWTRIDPHLTRTILRGVAILDDRTIVVVGDDGVILRSADGAATWSRVESGTTTHLNAVSFSSPSFGVAVGSGAQALYTTDAGAHWSLISLGMPLQMMSVEARPPILLGGVESFLRLNGLLMPTAAAGTTTRGARQ